jgi:hypothetical protein
MLGYYFSQTFLLQDCANVGTLVKAEIAFVKRGQAPQLNSNTFVFLWLQ